MKAITDTGIISAQGYMEEELSNSLRPLVKSMLQKDIDIPLSPALPVRPIL